jgi:hypothetical protein
MKFNLVFALTATLVTLAMGLPPLLQENLRLVLSTGFKFVL